MMHILLPGLKSEERQLQAARPAEILQLYRDEPRIQVLFPESDKVAKGIFCN
jgi:hypothetical protein